MLVQEGCACVSAGCRGSSGLDVSAQDVRRDAFALVFVRFRGSPGLSPDHLRGPLVMDSQGVLFPDLPPSRQGRVQAWKRPSAGCSPAAPPKPVPRPGALYQ